MFAYNQSHVNHCIEFILNVSIIKRKWNYFYLNKALTKKVGGCMWSSDSSMH